MDGFGRFFGETEAIYDGTKSPDFQWQGCVPVQGCGVKKRKKKRKMSESVESGDPAAMIETAWANRGHNNKLPLLVLADWLDENGKDTLAAAMRIHLENPTDNNLTACANNIDIGRFHFWSGRDNNPSCFFLPYHGPAKIPFRSRGPQHHWRGVRRGSQECYFFGAQFTRPGNMYDRTRRRRPPVWMVATPGYIFGDLEDGTEFMWGTTRELNENSEAGAVMTAACRLITTSDNMRMWRSDERAGLSVGQKLFCLLAGFTK